MEPIVTRELSGRDEHVTLLPGGASWRGDARSLYAANLHLRTATRVLTRVAEFRARTFFELERHVRRIAWQDYLVAEQPVRLRVSTRKSRLYHKRAIEERFAREIADLLGSRVLSSATEVEEGTAPEEGAEEGQLFVIRFDRDRCTVSADASGERLHRRGYRLAVARAPLRETLAAAMLLESGWTPADALLDPLCGSGTIPIEAALIARNIPPGLASPGYQPRSFAFERWPTFDAPLWETLLGEARSGIRDSAARPIRGSDRDAGAIDSATANAARAGVEADIVLEQRPLSGATLDATRAWLVTNPPYGVRVGEAAPLRDLYATLGKLVRNGGPSWRLALLAADDGLARHTGLRLTEALRTSNGGIPVKLLIADSRFADSG